MNQDTKRAIKERSIARLDGELNNLQSQLAAVTAELDRAVELLRAAKQYCRYCSYSSSLCGNCVPIHAFLAAYDSKRGATST